MITVLIDFDGVIHSYTSGWQGKQNVPDDPNPGAINFLRELISDEEFEPVIFTSRVHDEGWDCTVVEAKKAIQNWLLLQGMSPEEVDQLKITDQKLPAVLTVDDRAFQFRGTFPTRHYLRNFKPWSPGESS